MVILWHQVKQAIRETCTRIELIILLHLANWIQRAEHPLAPDLLRCLLPAEFSLWMRTRSCALHCNFLTGCFKRSLDLFPLLLQTLFTLLLFTALTVEFITGYFIWVRAEDAHRSESTQHKYKSQGCCPRLWPCLSERKMPGEWLR